MTRHEDWPDRLAQALEARRDVPFAWGAQDCMTVAADVVAQLRVDGLDFLAADRGTWGTEAEADDLLAARGGMETALADLAHAAGLPPVAVSRMGRGDLALVRVGNQLLAGICNGVTVAVTGADGLQFVPRRAAIRAWAV